jgi:hypothetical protein
MRDTQYRTAQKATLLEVVDDLVSSAKSHAGRISESEFTRIVRYSGLLYRRGSLFDFLAVTHAVGSYKPLG